MAFVLSQSPSYTWPVEIQIANDGGQHEKFTFDAEFKRLPSERVKEVLYPSEGTKSPSDEEFCREIVLGWSGIKDDKGADVPFSQDALEKLLKIHPAPAMIVKAWIGSISEAKEKN